MISRAARSLILCERHAICSLIALTLVCEMTPELAESEPPPRITIRISDTAAVPDAVLSRATRQAAHILGIAGVQIEWLSCPASGPLDEETRKSCGRPPGASDFWLHIVRGKLPNLSDHTLGATLLEGAQFRSAYVLYPRVKALAEELRIEEHVILSAAMAHEVGHLLLGTEN